MGLARRPAWQLPLNLTPVEKKRCIQLLIPDDDEYERLLYSAIYDAFCLTWMCWQRDGTRNGQNQVELWRRVLGTWNHCDNIPSLIYVEDYKNMPNFRTGCDPNGVPYIEWQVCTCPDTWQRLGAADLIAPLPPQGDGTPQPAPGGSQQYCTTIVNNGVYAVPTPISTGDVIALNSYSGSMSDNGVQDIYAVYRCPTGGYYFLGKDTGITVTKSGDVLPSAPHMSLIVNWYASDGSYISSSAFFPTTLTVTAPSGMSFGTATICPNCTDRVNGAENQGADTFCITVQNNAASPWTQVFDFTTNPYASLFIPQAGSPDPAGEWTPAVGWSAGLVYSAGSSYRYLVLELAMPHPASLTSVRMDYLFTLGIPSTTGQSLVIQNNGADIATSGIGTTPTSPTMYNTPISSTSMLFALLSGEAVAPTDPGGTAVISKITFTGTGTNPFV